MTKYVGAVDQGTTSTRFMIFDHAGKVVGVDQKEHAQIYPKPGWVEHDPMEIWARSLDVIKGALKKANLKADDLAAVGITNQRETTVVWDKRTGKPVEHAIVRLFSKKFSKLIETQVTDARGRYAFFAGPSEYFVTITAPGGIGGKVSVI